MNWNNIALILMLSFCVFENADAQKSEKEGKSEVAETVQSPLDSLAYAIAASGGQWFKKQGVKSLDPSLFAKGMCDLIEGKELWISENEAEKLLKRASTKKEVGIENPEEEKAIPTRKRKKRKKKRKSGKSKTVQVTLDSVAYAIGVMGGQSFKEDGVEHLDALSLEEGMRDVMTEGKELRISDIEIENLLNRPRQEKFLKNWGIRNLAAGKAFLADNAKKDGVVTLPSGLQYKIVKEGNGILPVAEDQVKTYYSISTVMKSGVMIVHSEEDEPIVFEVASVMKGWQEALQLMPVGSKWKVYVPSDLAYGERGHHDLGIGPNTTLVFDLELLDIEK